MSISNLQYAQSVWSTRPVFISSTFRDMHTERDYLRKVIFPEIEEFLLSRRCHFEPIDLRWGVETRSIGNQNEKELLVLKVCLAEIERSRPFMIVLLGDRYGWVPDEARMSNAVIEAGFSTSCTNKSVTALEIEYGALSCPEQRQRTFFYFREPLPYDEIPHEVAEQYSDSYSNDPHVESTRHQLDELKARIMAEMPEHVRHYHVKWDYARNTICGLDELGAMVRQDLLKALAEEFCEDLSVKPKNWEDEERWELEQFIEHVGHHFYGRENLVDQLVNTRKLKCLIGEPGMGKSALFARVYHELLHQQCLVLAHSAGISPRSMIVDDMLKRWIGELLNKLEKDAAPTDDLSSAELDLLFSSLVHEASIRFRVILMIDGLERFEQTPRARFMSWMPHPLPGNVRFIITSQPNFNQALELVNWDRDFDCISIPPLNSGEIDVIARAICNRYHRNIHTDVLSALKSVIVGENQLAAGNPLWLTIAVEELNLLDADDFERANISFAGTPDERLHQLLRSFVGQLPAEIPELYAWLLHRAEEICGKSWVQSFSLLLAASRQGWREADLKAMLPIIGSCEWDDLTFAMLRRIWRSHLIKHSSLNQWHFAHVQMAAAVERCYFKDKYLISELHGIFAKHLLSLPDNDPIRQSEVMVSLLLSDDISRAAKYFSDQSLTSESIIAAVNVIVGFLIDGETDGIFRTKHSLMKLLQKHGLTSITSELIISKLSAEQLADFNTDEYEERMHLLGEISNICTDELGDEEGKKIVMSLMDDFVLSNVYIMPSAMADYILRIVHVDELTTQARLCLCERFLDQVYLRLQPYSSIDTQLYVLTAILDVLYSIYSELQDAPEILTALNKAFLLIGDVLLSRGNVSRSLEYFTQAAGVITRHLKLNGSSPSVIFSVSRTLERRSFALSLIGKCQEAMKEFQTAAQCITYYRQQHPEDISAILHELSLITLCVDLMRKDGRTSEAFKTCRAGLDIIAKYHDDLLFQTLKVVLYHHAGDISLALGNVESAEEWYNQALASQQHLIALSPEKLEHRHILATCHEKIGDVRNANGSFPEAIDIYKKALNLYKEAYFPEHSTLLHLREMMGINVKIGRAYLSLFDFDEAVDAFYEAHRKALWLQFNDKDDMQYVIQQALIDLQYNIAYKVISDNVTISIDRFREAYTKIKSLLESTIEDCDQVSDIAQSFMLYAEILLQAKIFDESLESCRKGIELYKLLRERDHDNVRWPKELFDGYQRMAMISSVKGDIIATAESLVRLREAIDFMKQGMGYPDELLRVMRARLDALPGSSKDIYRLNYSGICQFMEIAIALEAINKMFLAGEVIRTSELIDNCIAICRQNSYGYDLLTLLVGQVACLIECNKRKEAFNALEEALHLAEQFPAHHAMEQLNSIHETLVVMDKHDQLEDDEESNASSTDMNNQTEHTNIFQLVKGGIRSRQEMVQLNEWLEENVGFAALLRYIDGLDQEERICAMTLLEQEDETAFTDMVAENSNEIQQIALHEGMRIKNTLLCANITFETIEELHEAIEALLPWRIRGIEWAVADTAEERLNNYMADITPEKAVPTKINLRKAIANRAISLLMESPLNDNGQLERLSMADEYDEIDRLLAEEGTNRAELYAFVINELTEEIFNKFG